jgi:hypothetical protein
MEALRQPEYVHVLLNHLPLTGLAVAVLFLSVALGLRNRTAALLGMSLVCLLALSAWPVSEYGEGGFDRVLAMTDDAGGDYLKHHRDLADRWVWLFYVSSAAAAAGLAVSWKWPNGWWKAALVVIALAVASLVAGAVIAECGGKVRHREFRTEAPSHAPPQGVTGSRVGVHLYCRVT